MQSAEWDERYAAKPAVWSHSPNQFVVEYLEHLPIGSMADIAGGEGRNALWFAERGWQAENVDFSAVAVARSVEWAAERNVSDRFVGTVSDATAADACITRPLDLIVMAYLQIPAAQLARAIQNAAAQLAPGGTFFGVWHAFENLEGGFGGPPSADVLPTRDELAADAALAGLQVEALELRDREVTFEDNTHTAIDVVLLARLAA